jgi:radical SAM superfamily enzyme with C-terminal helix-hairpin-helix motif
MVREFQEYRPYTSILQFRREIGKYVDEQTVAGYEDYVYVPIDVNAADADTLQQIPGLDATEAAALIAARPFASNEAFITTLLQHISADELAVAQSYLASQ